MPQVKLLKREFVGIDEISLLAGYSKKQVRKMAASRNFPIPVEEVYNYPIFSAESIDSFLKKENLYHLPQLIFKKEIGRTEEHMSVCELCRKFSAIDWTEFFVRIAEAKLFPLLDFFDWCLNPSIESWRSNEDVYALYGKNIVFEMNEEGIQLRPLADFSFPVYSYYLPPFSHKVREITRKSFCLNRLEDGAVIFDGITIVAFLLFEKRGRKNKGIYPSFKKKVSFKNAAWKRLAAGEYEWEVLLAVIRDLFVFNFRNLIRN